MMQFEIAMMISLVNMLIDANRKMHRAMTICFVGIVISIFGIVASLVARASSCS